jgi:hypothetical protein
VPLATGLKLGALASALILVAGCRPVITRQIASGPHALGCAPASCGDPRNLISVTYLGISGILVEHGEHALLTAPFFSNPRFGARGPKALRRVTERVVTDEELLAATWVGSGPVITSDTAAIERLLPRSADRASVILVGHGHYDHLLDIPYIATHRVKSALIFGGPSIRHMLMGDRNLRSNSTRVVAIPKEMAGDSTRDGHWYYSPDSAFRFMAIVADHAPTVMIGKLQYAFGGGALSTDLDSLPRTAGEWKLGEPYAFLIDVLSDSTRSPIFRIYFQDAPTRPPLGFPSAAVLAARGVDLAILCAATSSNVHAAPDSLLRVLKPGGVLVTHWESFFRPQFQPRTLSLVTNLRLFTRSLRRSLPPNTGWVMPLPHQTIRFGANPSR